MMNVNPPIDPMAAINAGARELIAADTLAMAGINADALKLAEAEALDGKLGFFIPRLDFNRLVTELTKLRETVCPITGQFDSNAIVIALTEFGNIVPDSIKMDVINSRARDIAEETSAKRIAHTVAKLTASMSDDEVENLREDASEPKT